MPKSKSVQAREKVQKEEKNKEEEIKEDTVNTEKTTVTAAVDPVVVSTELADLSVRFFGVNNPLFFVEKVGEKTLEGHRYDIYRASDNSTYDIPVA